MFNSIKFICIFALLAPRYAPASADLADVRLCILKLPGSTMPVLAKEAGYFKDEGLRVDLQPAVLGRECLARLKNGDIDYAMAFTTPTVRTASEMKDARIISQLHSSTRAARILYNESHGIHSPKDLQGKRVALVMGIDSQYLLQLFLIAHDLDANKVKLVDTPPEALVDRLVKGQVDAAVLWTPLVDMALAQSQALKAFDSSFFTEFSILTTRESEIKNGRAQKVLRALLRAEALWHAKPDWSRKVAEKWMGWPAGLPMDEIWSHHRLELKLSALFRTMFIQQLRFQKGRPLEGLNGWETINMADGWIQPGPLRAVSPQAVTYQ